MFTHVAAPSTDVDLPYVCSSRRTAHIVLRCCAVLWGTISCSSAFAVEAHKDEVAVTAPCKAFPLRASGVFEAKPVAVLAGLKS